MSNKVSELLKNMPKEVSIPENIQMFDSMINAKLQEEIQGRNFKPDMRKKNTMQSVVTDEHEYSSPLSK